MYGGPQRLSEDRTLLSEELDEVGYNTAGFHSNLYLSADFGYGRGFDYFFDAKNNTSTTAKLRQFVKQRLNPSGRLFQVLKSLFEKTERHAGVEVGSAYVDATDTTDRAVEWVSSVSDREHRFLWTHYMDVHHPYLPPERHQLALRDDPISDRRATKLRRRMLKEPETLSKSEHQSLIDLYDAEIRYFDEQATRLIETVREQWGKDTVVMLTADHGEDFMDHGNYSHGTLHDEGIHVPLLVSDGSTGQRYEEMTGLLDLVPTIASYAGIEQADNWYGHDLRNLINGIKWPRDSVIGNWGDPDSDRQEFFYRDRQWKYILHEDDRESLYDIIEDPDEQTDRSDREPDVIDRIRSEIESHLERVRATDRDLGEVHMDEETKERLAMLGYKEE